MRGRVLHEFYKENRSVVPLRQIPKPMVDAILSIEDRRFYSHWGIDPVRLFGALVQDVIARRPEQGHLDGLVGFPQRIGERKSRLDMTG